MITSKIISNGILKSIVTIVATLLLLYFIFSIKTILIYIVLSVILSLIANPTIEFLKKRLKFNNTLAVAFVLILFILLILGILALFVPLIITQSNNLSLLNTAAIQEKCYELYNQVTKYLYDHDVNIKQIISESNVSSKLNFNFLTNFFNSILNGISNFGIGLVAVFFISFFVLKDKVMFLAGIRSIIPEEKEEKITNSANKIKDLLTRYFIGLLMQLGVIFLLYLTVLLIFGIENAFVIAFLCSLLNVVPYVGALIGTSLAGILTMLSNINADFQTETLPLTIYVVIGFFIVQMIDNNVSAPIIFSKSLNSHPLEIFLVVLIFGTLFGIVGMIVAVPVFTIIKVIAKEFFPENKLIKVITKSI